jgi:aspartate aminotransferase-like enzyme
MMTRIDERLQKVFRTSQPVYTVTSSATGLMEGGVRNAVKSRLLCLINGAFSKRFHKAAVNSGIPCDKLEIEFGYAHTPEMLAEALKRDHYDAVSVVHSETSTGVLNPIAELAKVTHARGDVALLVDSVTGIAGSPVETDAWELDFVLTGSQKALALPPGLALGVARPSLLERAKTKKDRGIYFDFIEFEKNILKNQTPNTPALPLFYALSAQLDAIRRETIEARWERHAAMARRTWAWADEMKGRGLDIRVLAPEGYRSSTITCLTMPAGQSGSAVTSALKQRGFTIAAGYGALKDATIRIGHMGDHTVAELDVLLAELEQVLAA